MSKPRDYELTYILAPDLDDAEKTKVFDRLKDTLTDQFGGEVLKVDEWGRRKLAYAIKKHAFGTYIHMRMRAPGEAIAELERVMRLMDPVIKFLTVRLEDGAAIETTSPEPAGTEADAEPAAAETATAEPANA